MKLQDLFNEVRSLCAKYGMGDTTIFVNVELRQHAHTIDRLPIFKIQATIFNGGTCNIFSNASVDVLLNQIEEHLISLHPALSEPIEIEII